MHFGDCYKLHYHHDIGDADMMICNSLQAFRVCKKVLNVNPATALKNSCTKKTFLVKLYIQTYLIFAQILFDNLLGSFLIV